MCGSNAMGWTRTSTCRFHFRKRRSARRFTVPSLEGELSLGMHPGTQSGTTFRMRGHGMPAVRGNHRGDHVVTVHVVVPTKVNKRQRELLEEYARQGGDHLDERSFFDKVKDAFKPE